jgi:Na+-driven multidrug efflux pump
MGAKNLDEARVWWSLAWPSSIASFADLLPWLINLSFVGHASASALAALSLTETWLYAFSVVVWSAFAAAGSTLVSQAHGARSLAALRGWGAMTLAGHLLAALCVSGAWLGARPALGALGFDRGEALRAQSFTLCAIPALFFMAVQISASVYLAGVQVVGLPLAAAACAAALDTLVSYVLIQGVGGSGPLAAGMDDKLRASALSWVAGSAAGAAVSAAGVLWVRGREFDFGGGADGEGGEGGAEGAGGGAPRASAINEAPREPLLPPRRQRRRAAQPLAAFLASRARWGTFLAQLGPALLTACVESSQFTVISFLAASLGDAAIAAHNTSICLLEVTHTVARGMAEATAVRVGYHLGRGDSAGARRAARVALAASALWGAAVAAAGFAARAYLPLLFSADARVVALSVDLAPSMWGSYALLAVGDAALGVLQGQGRASAESGAAFFGTWCVGLPLAVACWRERWGGLPALWGAMLVGYAALALLALAAVWRSDWESLAVDARERVGEEEEEEEEEEEGGEEEKA